MSHTDPAQIYRQEAAELLAQLEQALLDLEQAPADADLVNTAFRALHTIKGSGAMFGFDRVAGFTHHVETAFDRLRKGQATASGALIAVTLAAKDHIGRLIERPDTTDDADGAAILRELQEIVAMPTRTEAPDAPSSVPSSAASSPPLSPPGPPQTAWRLRFRLPRDAMALGTNPLLLLDELRALGPCVVRADTTAIPPLDELDPTECHVGWDVTLSTNRSREAIEQVFLFVLDGMQLALDRIEPAAPASIDTIAPPAPAQASPVTAQPAAAPPINPAAAPPINPAAAPPINPAAAPPINDAHFAGPDSTAIRVPAERLDELMDRVGELVIAQSRLKQVAAASNDAGVKSAAEEIERLALELRDSTMGARMVPIGQLFGRFRRLVHDLSRDLGKDIALVTEGEDTELDKTLIERLGDPLIHLIRNAADHGLEPAATRLAAGKPGRGRVSLTARHLGHEVLITIGDDGRGLDRARIQQRAEEQGLLAPGAKPSDAELFQVLFQPGFSTAREVTSMSGRGVGMDVVRRAIDTLRGGIDIASTAGAGTQVTLHLPLTLAIIDGLLVRVGKGRYVIPLSAIEECVALSVEADTSSQGHSFLNVRDKIVPFLRLRELFDTGTPPDQFQKVVIVASGDQRVGLVVDQVIGDHQTVIKSLSRLHADVAAFSGATILGDGAVALILEVTHLVGHGGLREDRTLVAA
jgi:two-component system chemotaxis sensor kinase CheA